MDFFRCIAAAKAAVPGVQCGNLLHFGIGQRKIEDVQIFFHAPRIG